MMSSTQFPSPWCPLRPNSECTGAAAWGHRYAWLYFVVLWDGGGPRGEEDCVHPQLASLWLDQWVALGLQPGSQTSCLSAHGV